MLGGFENSSSWRELLNSGNANAGSGSAFSQLAKNAANSPPSSRSSPGQNNPFNNNQYRDATGAVNGSPLASTQTPEGALVAGRNANVAPTPNGPFPPNPAGAAPANSRATSAFLSDLSYTASFNATNGLNPQALEAIFSTTPAGWQDNGQGPQFQFPNNVNSLPQPFQDGNSSTSTWQSLNNTNSSTLSSQSSNNTNPSTEPFQLLSRNVSASEMPAEATHGGRATSDSVLPDRSTSRSPLHMSPEQSTAALPINARGSAATNNEALTKAPLEKGAGFLGF